MRITLLQANDLLERQEIVAIPTETVYGLAALLKFPEAIEKIYSLKQRPGNNPLIIHIATLEQLEPLVKEFPPGFTELTNRFWPGPLTLVVPARIESTPEIARAGLSTIACRMPSHPLAKKLIQMTGPLVAPSANLSGRPSATQPEHIEIDFGKDFPILDAGLCAYGVESTILYWQVNQWKVGRLGAISLEELQEELGHLLYSSQESLQEPICPGQLYRHYAPKATLILGEGEYDGIISTVLGFQDREYKQAQEVISLGLSSHPSQVAQNLYSVLRILDQKQITCAWVDTRLPQTGLWTTILERLKKAAQK